MKNRLTFFLVCVFATVAAGSARAQHATHPAGETRETHAPLQALASAMADGASALAADDLAKYKTVQPAIRQAYEDLAEAEPELAKALVNGPAQPFSDQGTIAAARKEFAPFSTAVADAARARKLLTGGNLHVFECTMVPQVGKARWLQRGAVVKNPFFGAAMPRCGTEVGAEPATTRALPPGHPPIGHLTQTERQSYKTKTSQPTCGSCGMSQAAMASGEPCESSTVKQ